MRGEDVELSLGIVDLTAHRTQYVLTKKTCDSMRVGGRGGRYEKTCDSMRLGGRGGTRGWGGDGDGTRAGGRRYEGGGVTVRGWGGDGDGTRVWGRG